MVDGAQARVLTKEQGKQLEARAKVVCLIENFIFYFISIKVKLKLG
jgi:hypothetical protein